MKNNKFKLDIMYFDIKLKKWAYNKNRVNKIYKSEQSNIKKCQSPNNY